MRRIIRGFLLIFILNILVVSGITLMSQQLESSLIAYTISEHVRHSSVELIDARTGQTLNLVTDIGEGEVLGRTPQWSPDGQHIALWTIHNRSDSLAFEIKLDDYSVTNLTEAYGYFSMPIYGANNQQLYASLPTINNTSIFLVNETYPEGEQILPTTLSVPQWSSDGRYIAYLNRFEDLETGESLSSGTNAPEIDLYVLDTTTRDIVNHTIGFSNIGTPYWSPDGTQIAFISTQRNFGQIYILDLATGEINEIPVEMMNAINPLVWSPDGTQLAFTSNQVGLETPINGEVMVIDMTSFEMRNVSQSPLYDTDPTWSPDSEYLAFVSRRDGNQSDIFIANVDTGNLRRLTYTSANETDLSWRPR